MLPGVPDQFSVPAHSFEADPVIVGLLGPVESAKALGSIDGKLATVTLVKSNTAITKLDILL